MDSDTQRKYPDHKILSLFPNPLYTETHIYFEEDLSEMGLGNVLGGFDSETRDTIYNHAQTLARIKSELCFHFLCTLETLLKLIPLGEMERWIRVVLDMYDSQGLNPAREFILRCDEHPEFARFWGQGISFQETSSILSGYLHALGKQEIKLDTRETHYTDLETIYLPERIDVFPERDLNFLLYKVMVTHKFAQCLLGTYHLKAHKLHTLLDKLARKYRAIEGERPASDLSLFIKHFPDPVLAGDLFNLCETFRIEAWIAENLPGLDRDLQKLKRHLGLKRNPNREIPPRTLIMERVIYWRLTGRKVSLKTLEWDEIFSKICALLTRTGMPGSSAEDSAEMTSEVYMLMERAPEPYEAPEPVLYVGELKPEEAEQGRLRRRTSLRNKFRQELVDLVRELPECDEIRIEVADLKREHPLKRSRQRQGVPDFFLINGNFVPHPEAMRKIIDEIYEDLGSLPSSYLAFTNEMSGHHFRSLCKMPEGTGYVLSEHGEGIHILDEWDYRRQGYRKRWALLRETEAPAGESAFAQEILKNNNGMIRQIKRQFERIQMEQGLLRRQSEGDSVDFDAAVEAFVDQKAGLCPSERLFMRLKRDKRDIATVFLIDLSGSTSGWINEMERAALLILSEAIQVLRDRFAIYGFSGRTRRRCELYRIKGFDEDYGDVIKARISGLKALEYTRLGPPIRHLTGLLKGMEARTRFLITLSDGKPDDYDGYKGNYGIEDTRQALLEAKTNGIHPFCITIDKAEHSYLAHMYGAVNYVFIDNLAKLPVKVPEIYRKLTT